jgi:hypothetical protein
MNMQNMQHGFITSAHEIRRFRLSFQKFAIHIVRLM